MFGLFGSRPTSGGAAERAQRRREKARRSRELRSYRAEDTFWRRHRRK